MESLIGTGNCAIDTTELFSCVLDRTSVFDLIHAFNLTRSPSAGRGFLTDFFFGSRHPLMMNPHAGKDTALAYLKVVVHLLNENKDELDLTLGRPLRIEDLDHLTSHQMLNIVTFMLREVIGHKPIFKSIPLNDFNKFGVGNASYDCGIDKIYHAVKQIFPEDCDLFHYSVLLLPAANPKRTKAVISYIMSFVLMCDNLDQQFNECFNEVMKENEEKGALYRTIDELKDKISAKIQEREMEKNRLPTLQKELQTLEDNIKKQQSVLGKLNTELDKLKEVYEAEEMRTKSLEQEAERIDTERVILEQQIVANPKDLRNEHESVKKQLEAETRTRERIGEEKEKHAKDCDAFESLMQHADYVIKSIKAAVTLMEDTKLKIEFYTKTGNEITASSQKVVAQKEELRKLMTDHSEKVTEINSLKENLEFRLEELRLEIPKAEEQILQTKEKVKAEKNKCSEISKAIEDVRQNIEKMEKQHAAYVKNIAEDLPRLKSHQEAEAMKLLKRVKESFTYYPMLDSYKLDAEKK